MVDYGWVLGELVTVFRHCILLLACAKLYAIITVIKKVAELCAFASVRLLERWLWHTVFFNDAPKHEKDCT